MRLLGLGVPSFYLAKGVTGTRLLRWVRQVRRRGYAEIVARKLGSVRSRAL